MAVSSVSSSSSSIYGNRNVISGMASGMDTESMIENMVMGIKTKIDTQKQNQQLLMWQQEAYRSISDQLVQISTKYTSYTSSTNLMSAAFFQPSIITALGKYADKVSAAGSTNSDIQIAQISQLAKSETVSFKGLNGVENSNSIQATDPNKAGVDLTGTAEISEIAGQQMSFKYGNESFTITFDSNKEYETLDDVVDEINRQLGNASVSLSDGESIKMNSKVEAKVVEAMDAEGNPTGDKTIAFTFKDGAEETNTLEIQSYSSPSVLNALNFSAGDTLSGAGVMASSSPVKDADLKGTYDTATVLAGATMNVTYNGKTATIRMPEKGSDEYNKIFGDGVTAEDAAKNMEDYLQSQFDQAFGYGRISVDNISGDSKLFKPSFSIASGSESETLSIDSGSLNVIGKGGIFGIERGASNRVNTGKTLGDLYGTTPVQEGEKEITQLGGALSGLTPVMDGDKIKTDENGNAFYALEINGVKIGEYTADTTLETIINDVNSNEKAGVSLSYSKTSNQFVFTSKHGGTGGQVEITGDSNLAAGIFGSVTYSTDPDTNEVTVTEGDPDRSEVIRGQDAKMVAYINGARTELSSGTNSFDIDGFTVTATGTFGETGEDGAITEVAESDRITFNKKVDADKIVDAIKSFVEDYNKVLAEVNEQYSTKPDSTGDYKPLTDDQKAELTEKQIEEYEAKAKQGLLFGDSDLGGLASGLRFLFSDSDLSDIGINVSTDYSDKGKISLDESKLRAALESDPDKVASAFTDPLEEKKVTNKDGSISYETDTSSGGAMSRLKVQLDKYASTTGAVKGILIEKAGSQYSPMALLENTLQEKIDGYDDVIDKLTDQLNDKIDFYTSKFSKLEALIAQMNSQSSYLASMGGSGY